MKNKLLVFSLSLLVSIATHADEGMWLLPLINEYNMSTMQSMGLEIDAKAIYSTSQPSIKDGVVIFGRGCTGSIISDQGLVFTNHHCGYDAIQHHSSTETDYLKDGFWAMENSEEIHTPNLTVTLLVSIDDVTDAVTSYLDKAMSEEERLLAIEVVTDSISLAATHQNHYNARVQDFYGGNAFYLLVYETFHDVRLVGAPPSSIGKFGADTDNWTWPRHTGDFALFRIYADSTNRPANYSPSNIPYTPKQHIPISLKEIQEEDFAMILGYSGSTQRYSTSWEVEETQNIINTNRAAIREVRQEALLDEMLADDAIRIKYATKYARSANYWKYSIGQNNSLNRLNIIEDKRKREEAFTQWVNNDPARSNTYGTALDLIESAVKQRAELVHASLYLRETLLAGTELFLLTTRSKNLQQSLADTTNGHVEQRAKNFKTFVEEFYQNYHAPTDLKVAKELFPLFAQNVSEGYQPPIFREIEDEYQGCFDIFLNEVYQNSMFTDTIKLWEFLNNPSLDALEADPAYQVGRSVWEAYEEIMESLDIVNLRFSEGHRLYVAALLEKNSGQPSYPDANFTMRLSYGQVKSYYPRDAVHYNYYTTLSGVMEKEDPDSWEFVVPTKLKDLYEEQEYGPYAMADGRMPIGFISNNDITGGNSGSPVLNAQGQIIGCAFDGNWEAMSGDIVFEPELQRTISVDIRYALFIIDKFAGAKHLIDEMTLVYE